MAETDLKKIRDKAREGLHEAADAASDATQRAAGVADDNARTFAEMSTVLASSFQEISREWWTLTQNRLKTNLELSNKLLSCRTVPDALAVQGELAKANIDQFLNDTRRLMELWMNGMGKMTRHIEAGAERVTSSGPACCIEVTDDIIIGRECAAFSI